MSVRSFLALGSTAVLALGIGLSAVATTAEAGSLTAVDIMNTYNLVVFGDLDSNSEVEGKTFVQGNLTGGSSNYNIKDIATSSAPALTVGGNIANSGLNVNGKGLVVGGNLATTGSVNINENGSGNGDVVIGGNVTSNTTANFNGNGNLYVKGSIGTPANHVNVNANGGSIYVGQTVGSGSNANANGGGQLHTGSSEPASHLPGIAGEASDMKQTLSSYSGYLNSLKPDSTVSVVSGTAEFNAVAGANGVAVFNVSDASILNAGQFQFTAGSDVSSIIVNVTLSGLLDITTNFVGDISSLANKIIWNFTDASGITINRDFDGSILALLANVTNNQDIEGTLIAKSVIQNGEVHDIGTVQGVLPTPLPASLPLFAAAFIGLAGWRQFRRRPERAPFAA